LGNVRRTAHLGRLLAPLLALASVLAVFAALPPNAVTGFPTSLAAGSGSHPGHPDQDHSSDRGPRSAITGAVRSQGTAGRQFIPNSSNETSVASRLQAAALREMPDAATPVTDGRGWSVSKQRNALAWSGGGVTVAPVRILL
jgi:hypothetical protein